eukprot:TRINITY_DN67972_c0_g1_i1.p2 TRINITY_DN67972_c0_g1~~TRINITY_DN67972_c0_g1_i1.p2  ORF type:complete len:279 (-),score=47.86 TRINITY_DN67972_c0_g1_i1:321-1157(-)
MVHDAFIRTLKRPYFRKASIRHVTQAVHFPIAVLVGLSVSFCAVYGSADERLCVLEKTTEHRADNSFALYPAAHAQVMSPAVADKLASDDSVSFLQLIRLRRNETNDAAIDELAAAVDTLTAAVVEEKRLRQELDVAEACAAAVAFLPQATGTGGHINDGITCDPSAFRRSKLRGAVEKARKKRRAAELREEVLRSRRVANVGGARLMSAAMELEFLANAELLSPGAIRGQPVEEKTVKGENAQQADAQVVRATSVVDGAGFNVAFEQAQVVSAGTDT